VSYTKGFKPPCETYELGRTGLLLTPTYANPPGLNGWLEMQRLVKVGETPAQIFQSATTLSNAQALHLEREIGSVQVGERANLLLLRQNPTQTIQSYRVLDPADLVANRLHRP
jgi:imidazolonepropionase-like amidohydrolase